MPDIFISYSRKDSEQATMLAELLSSAGLSCWIDRERIEAAGSWSAQIVDAINECRVWIALLSPHSVASHNVIKEISLASEKRKKILPLDLEPVILPRELEYQLAGIQRAPMTNIDAIIRALSKLGLEATGAPKAPKIVKEKSDRKSLMILPFEDLSPSGDNEWFANGIVSEMISALSNIKALKLTDLQETKAFKRFQGHLTTYAREMQIRYFVQGDVRKFGDTIKISSRLLDVDTGDYLWQDSIKGTMNDVFDIQEEVARKVVEGLQLHLSSEEKTRLSERGTANADAYELFLRAGDYSARATKDSYGLATQLCTEAIALDPGFAEAYQRKATILVLLHRKYDRNPTLLEEAERLCTDALRLKPDLVITYHPLSMLYTLQGKLEEAEAAAREIVRQLPEHSDSHFVLGSFFMDIGEYAKSIAPFEESYRRDPDNRFALFNLVINCFSAKQLEQCREWALTALPIEERYLKLHPDDENSRMHYAIVLFFAGRIQDARMEMRRLEQARDGGTLYNVACLYAEMGDKRGALAAFRKSMEAGFVEIHLLQGFLTSEDEGIGDLEGTPGYDEAKRMVEQISEEHENRNA